MTPIAGLTASVSLGVVPGDTWTSQLFPIASPVMPPLISQKGLASLSLITASVIDQGGWEGVEPCINSDRRRPLFWRPFDVLSIQPPDDGYAAYEQLSIR